MKTPPPAEETTVVLLVEDDDLVRQTVRYYLEKNGFRVLVAADGPEALQVAASAADVYSVLITDMYLPGTTGTVLAATLSRRGLGVIYIAAHGREHLLASGKISPFDIALSKPFSESELIEAMRRALVASE